MSKLNESESESELKVTTIEIKRDDGRVAFVKVYPDGSVIGWCSVLRELGYGCPLEEDDKRRCASLGIDPEPRDCKTCMCG